MKPVTRRLTLLAVLTALTAIAIPALAERDDDDGHERHERSEQSERHQPGDAERGRQMAATPADPVWKNECGSCHIPFPAGMLPAASWQKMMGKLSDHFGSDASLTPAEQKRITSYLVSNAGEARGDNTLRISKTGWFKREHREVRASTWKRPTVKSPANCQACHTHAADGDFNEHGIKIPH